MSKLRSIVLLILFIFFITSLTRNLVGYYKNLSYHKDYADRYKEEDKRNRTLKTQVLKEKDPNELEKTIRNKLNLSQPNEIVIMVPTVTPTPTVYIKPTVPVYKEWIDVLF